MGNGISGKLKDAIWRRDEGYCHYCGMFLKRSDPERTLDHVIPKCREDSSNRMWNLVLSCRGCNINKGDSDPSDELLALVMTRKAWSEAYVTLGKAIGRARAAGEDHEALILIGLQKAVWRAMHNIVES